VVHLPETGSGGHVILHITIPEMHHDTK